jgi:transposase
LPSERSGQMVADVLGQPISEGTLEAAIDLCAAELAETATGIKPGLARAEVAHCDETGRYVTGKRQWLHAAATAPLPPDACHDHRGATATQASGILPACGGRARHDGCSASWQ